LALTARLQRCQEKSLAPARTCNRDSTVIQSITYLFYGLTNAGFLDIITEIGTEDKDWIWLVEDRVHPRASCCKKRKNIRVPQNTEEFLNN